VSRFNYPVMNAAINRKLKELREVKGLSQAKASREIEVFKEAVHNMEKDYRKCSVAELMALQEVYDFRLDEFFSDVSDYVNCAPE